MEKQAETALSQDSYFSPTDLSSQDIQQAKVGHNMGTVG